MALSEDVKKTIRARIHSDPAFRFALLSQVVQVLLVNDMPTAKSVLHDYIDATIGFEALAARSGLSEKNLVRMLSSTGNPRAENLFRVIAILQQNDGIQLEVRAAA